MARHLALEWNSDEIRAIIASTHRGGRVIVEDAFTVELPVAGAASPPDDAEASAPDDHVERNDFLAPMKADEAEEPQFNATVAGERLRAALDARRVGRIETVVALERNQVELRRLVLPNAPDDELPAMVQFQAAREFNAFGADWLLDFTLLSDSEEGSPEGEVTRPVMAAAVSPDVSDEVRRVCEAAGVRLEKILLQPAGSIALWSRDPKSAGSSRGAELLLGLSHGHADLIVLSEGRAVFMRTARLQVDPLDNPNNVLGLGAEIRRTIMAAHQQLGDQRVERIVLRGDGPRHRELAQALGSNLSMMVTCFNSLAFVERTGEAAALSTDDMDAFAPLVGLLSEQTDPASRPMFDFLHPREAPKPVGRRNTIALAATAAVLLIAALFGWRFYSDYQVTQDHRRLAAKEKQLSKEMGQIRADAAQAREIAEWEQGRIDWLDELHWLSTTLPDSEEAMLTWIHCQASRTGGKGAMEINGIVRDNGTFSPMEKRLREKDAFHVITPGDKSDNESEQYRRKFDGAKIAITPISLRGEPGAKPAGKPLETPNENTSPNEDKASEDEDLLDFLNDLDDEPEESTPDEISTDEPAMEDMPATEVTPDDATPDEEEGSAEAMPDAETE